jgi:hypothetical protein
LTAPSHTSTATTASFAISTRPYAVVTSLENPPSWVHAL